MKKLSLLASIATSTLFSSSVFAANYGEITDIWFSGPNDPNHSNIVQISIDGGFDSGECNPTFGAIRNTEDRQHMISFALAAYATKTKVRVVLDGADTYYSDKRCTISRISSR